MPSSERLANVHRLAGVCAGISVGVGLAVLIGWIGGFDSLKTVLPGHVAMKANTAIGFVLLGSALWLLRDEAVSVRARHAAQILGGLVATFAALTLIEYVLGTSLGIDGLFDDPGVSSSYPGRASPHTAAAFLAVGIWIACLPLSSGWGLRVRSCFEVVACIIVFQAFVGYLFQVDYLYGITAVSGMAMHTMATFVVLCAGIVVARSQHGFMGVMTSTGAGGHMARRLAPALVVLPLLIAYLRLIGQEQGLYGTREGVTIMAGTTVVLLTAIAFVTARALNRADAERGQLEARLQEQADRDPMTNLFNRRGFEKEVDRHLALAQRYGERVAVIALDVDGLKEVNDGFGHAVGDELLIELTRRWTSALRVTDAFGRLGGDEFVVMLPQSDPAGAEEVVAAKLVEVAHNMVVSHDSRPISITASAGIAVADHEPFDRASLLQAADQALYAAKAAGGDRYVVGDGAAAPAPAPA